MAADHGHPLPADLLSTRFAAAFRLHGAARAAHPSPAAEFAFWRQVVLDCLHPEVPLPRRDIIFQDLYETFARPASWRLHEGVTATLAALRQAGFTLVVLSNNDSRLRPVLAGLGLLDFFHHVFISAEIGAEKPTPAAFAAVQSALRLPPSSLLHIGDSLAADYHGARQAGWHALLFDPAAPDPSPVPTLRHHPSLLPLLLPHPPLTRS